MLTGPKLQTWLQLLVQFMFGVFQKEAMKRDSSSFETDDNLFESGKWKAPSDKSLKRSVNCQGRDLAVAAVDFDGCSGSKRTMRKEGPEGPRPARPGLAHYADPSTRTGPERGAVRQRGVRFPKGQGFERPMSEGAKDSNEWRLVPDE